jgi:hypothetical protein
VVVFQKDQLLFQKKTLVYSEYCYQQNLLAMYRNCKHKFGSHPMPREVIATSGFKEGFQVLNPVGTNFQIIPQTSVGYWCEVSICNT